MLGTSGDERRGSLYIRVGSSTWSPETSFEAVSASANLTMACGDGSQEMHVGLSWVQGTGKVRLAVLGRPEAHRQYKLSKIITIQPRFFIKNLYSSAILVREEGSDELIRVPPNEHIPICTINRNNPDCLVRMAFDDANRNW